MGEPGLTESQQDLSEIVASEEPSAQALFLYIFGSDALKGGPVEFPSQLSLSRVFEPYVHDLDGQRQNIKMELHPGDKTIGLDPVQLEGEGEVSKTIYFDMKTGSVSATDTVSGDLSSVRSSIYDAVGESQRPLIEMHNHPGDSLPSVVDYRFMILGDPETRERAVRAIMVLTPQRQILALVTDETPFLTHDQIDQLFAEREEPNSQYEGEEGKRLKTLENRLKIVDNFALKTLKRSLEGGLEAARLASSMSDLKERNSGIQEEFSQVMTRVGKVRPRVLGKHLDQLYKVFTGIQLQFARDMGIKLYTSTDFKNFEAIPEQPAA